MADPADKVSQARPRIISSESGVRPLAHLAPTEDDEDEITLVEPWRTRQLALMRE